jgi:hypothetical protein
MELMTWVIIIGIAILIWLAIREVITWYFKIDTIVSQLDKQNRILIAIHDLLEAEKKRKDRTEIIETGKSIEL